MIRLKADKISGNSDFFHNLCVIAIPLRVSILNLIFLWLAPFRSSHYIPTYK